MASTKTSTTTTTIDSPSRRGEFGPVAATGMSLGAAGGIITTWIIGMFGIDVPAEVGAAIAALYAGLGATLAKSTGKTVEQAVSDAAAEFRAVVPLAEDVAATVATVAPSADEIADAVADRSASTTVGGVVSLHEQGHAVGLPNSVDGGSAVNDLDSVTGRDQEPAVTSVDWDTVTEETPASATIVEGATAAAGGDWETVTTADPGTVGQVPAVEPGLR